MMWYLCRRQSVSKKNMEYERTSCLSAENLKILPQEAKKYNLRLSLNIF